MATSIIGSSVKPSQKISEGGPAKLTINFAFMFLIVALRTKGTILEVFKKLTEATTSILIENPP